MLLLTKELIERFEKVGSQTEIEDPIAICKFFNPVGHGYWFATEYYPKERVFYGYVSLFGDWNDEWGTFALDELESIRGLGGLGIERDRFFKETPMSEIIKKYTK